MSDPSKKLEAIQLSRKKLDEKEYNLASDLMSSGNPFDIMKAQGILSSIQERMSGAFNKNRKSFLIDPWDELNNNGYRNKPFAINYDTLRRMSKTPIINSIIKTRINQIASFSQPQPDRHSVGFVIRKKRGYFAKNNNDASDIEKREIENITQFIIDCGQNDSWIADDFDSFLRMLAKDSFTFDQACFEIIRNKKGEPHEFFIVDASTIRIADSYDDDTFQNAEGIKKIRGYYPSYVQIYRGEPTASFYPWELCWITRNPDSAINGRGYGRSELEDLVTTVTSLLHSEEYNRKFFSQGSAPKGIIRVKGDNIDKDKLKEFRQQWQAMVSGVNNAWKTPVMESDQVDYIDLQKTNRDMEFSSWVEFLIKVSCAVYSIDPAEVNFPYGQTESKPLFDGNNESRLKFSKDKGLRPALKAIESKINKWLVRHFYGGKYEFAFVGLDSLSVKEETELTKLQIENFKTINEAREEWNLEPLQDGDVVANAHYLSSLQMREQKELYMQQMGMSGEDAEGSFAEDSEGKEQFQEEGDNPIAKAFNDYIIKEFGNE